MPVAHMYSFLVKPGKSLADQPGIAGVRVTGANKLVEMLSALYENAEKECDIEIIFRPSADGSQTNPCRSLLLDYLRRPSLPAGRAIAKRLQENTTRRSGLGLLFVVDGAAGRGHRLFLSRFPADQGIVAEATGDSLDVDFIEQIFMKNSKTYKAVAYTELATGAGFWEGRAVDKQTQVRELTNYWIDEFLDSDLQTTAAAGSKRLALAMREAIQLAPNAAVRGELLAATRLLAGQNGRRVSPEQVAHSFGLSPEALSSLRSAMPHPEMFAQTFEFSADEFNKHAPYLSVELDNGGVLIAPQPTFGEVFKRETIGPQQDRVRFTTEGTVVDERIRKTK